MALGLDDEVEKGHIARPVFEAPVGHPSAELAGGDGGGRHVKERDPELLVAEGCAQLGFGVRDGDDLVAAYSDPLAEVVIDLRREGDRVIDAVLRVDLGDGARGYREQVGQARILAKKRRRGKGRS